MKLTGEQIETLTTILVGAIEDTDELERLVRTRLNMDLQLITDSDRLQHATFKLVEWADREYRVEDLLNGMCAAKPRNVELRDFTRDWKASESSQRPPVAPPAPVVPVVSSIETAGIASFVDDFNKGIEWERLFAESSKLDILFAYGRTWRKTYRADLISFVTRSAVTIRVVLADPDHAPTLTLLAEHFQYDQDELRKLIKDAIIYFQNLQIKASEARSGATVNIRLMSAVPQFSFYCFDDEAVVSWTSHRREPDPVPSLVVTRGGKLYAFLSGEFNAIIAGEHGISKPIAP